MKPIAKVSEIKGGYWKVRTFRSMAAAAIDARMSRYKFSRMLKKDGQVKVNNDLYVEPKED